MTEISTLLVLTIFPAAMIAAAVSDLFTMTISNKVSIGLVVGFLLLAAISGMDAKTIGMNLLAGAAMLAVSFALFAKGWIGGGDAKLFAATVVWMGWSNLLEYTLVACIFGGALTILMLALRSIPMPAALVKRDWFNRLHALENGVPYGLALAAGGITIYPSTAIFSLITP
jgi:prepilin peptidase CpaA